MHNHAMEMGKWAMEKAKACGFENLSSQDWDNLRDCMEVVKCAICADKDYRIVKTMDEADEEEKYFGRMGYDRYRYADGRFAPKGRGVRMGYKPYIHMQDDEWMDEYMNNPDFERNLYRMGYHPEQEIRREPMKNEKHASKHGDLYDKYYDYRKHYKESKDYDSKQKMENSMKEYTDDIIQNIKDMWEDADANVRQEMKTNMTRLVQQMN